MAFGAQLPYLPVWLDAWGLSTAEIGYFLGAATLARIVGSTILPALADRYAVRRWLVSIAALAAAGIILSHLVISTESALLAATLAFAVLAAPTVPLGEALGLRAAGRFGFPYGPIRAAGSVAFLLSNILVGAWIGSAGPDVVIWVVAFGLVLAAALATVHPGGGAAASSGDDRATTADLRALARTPVFAIFTLAVAMGQGAHVVFYVYSSLAWQDAGISSATIGWLWAIGVMAETVLLLGPGRVWVARLGPGRALALAAMAGVLRWSMMALAPDLTWLWPLQAMHALTFALAHLAAMAFLAQAIPPRMAGSAQGVVSGVIGGSTHAAAMALAAILAERYGISTAYILAAGMAVLAVGLALILRRTWQGGFIVPETEGEPR